ncbi:hypothetical protein G6F68_016396 [Rhizopus microsporus]|nr:hypothetical protein G6F68_016396 [Rhizopus microsporus]
MVSGPLPIRVGLGGREHILATGDVDLAAAEVDRVQALLHRADHFLRVMLAGTHVGVGHAWHGQVRERFAAPVAGRCHAHQAGIEAVLHVAHQDAVLDQRGALAGVAFVGDVQRPAAAIQRAVTLVPLRLKSPSRP